MLRTRLLLPALLLAACGGASGGNTTTLTAGGYDQLTRPEFNALALRLNVPLFWAADEDGDGAVDPGEIRTLLFYGSTPTWTVDGHFSTEFSEVYAQLLQLRDAPPPANERERLVRQELDSAALTLVETDVASLSPVERALVERMAALAVEIDGIYAEQTGMSAISGVSGTESEALFRRNWGVRCLGSATESNPACSALAGAEQHVGVYPASIQSGEGFCATLEEHPESAALLSPFTVVEEREGELVAVPYSERWASRMSRVAGSLREGAAALPAEEAALAAYMRAAADAFESNEWEPADEAWAAMNVNNSSWYLRIGPDEVYWDPCSRKAGFHLPFARINRDSLRWQEALTPLRSDMEQALASLSEGYDARDVAFHVPDFIDIVINAGDDRDAFGATIGQSLPNWGPVSEEGRGRTVAMSNLYTDPDSAARGQETVSSMLDAATMALYTSSPEPGLLSTILHEATHNLGPERVNGQDPAEVFGGGLASMLEELKAQTGALFFIPMLRERGVLSDELARQTYIDSITWAFGHISRGMYTPSGQRKAYSQLAAIQVGYLMDQGVITWDAEALAANGSDHGAFHVDLAAIEPHVRALMTTIIDGYARGDRAAIEALAARYVDGDVVPMATIVERYQRRPHGSLVYAFH